VWRSRYTRDTARRSEIAGLRAARLAWGMQKLGPMRQLATVAAGLLGLALATWGVVQLTPRDLYAAEADDDPVASHPGVRSVRFRGDAEPGALAGQLRTRAGAPLDGAALARDRAQLEAGLVDEGFLDAHVAVSGTRDVVFTIDAGPVYRTGAIRLVGELAAKFPALADELTVASGEELSTRAIDRTEDRLSTWLSVHGVARARVTHRLDVDHAAKRVDVTYDAEPFRSVAAR
jgi:outer membrane protein assembly factor BamA